MQKEETTIILQNPDGTIQIATQPQFKNKNVIQCWNCKMKLIYDASANYVKCSCCNSLSQVPGKTNESNFVVVECAGCRVPIKGQADSFAIQCPFCRTVTCL